LAVVLAVHGTVMPTATDQFLAGQVVEQLRQVTVAELGITDIETSQLTEHQDRDSQVVREYDLINKVKTYTLPEVAVEQADPACVQATMPMTEK
jgi:hypothetical protein